MVTTLFWASSGAANRSTAAMRRLRIIRCWNATLAAGMPGRRRGDSYLFRMGPENKPFRIMRKRLPQEALRDMQGEAVLLVLSVLVF
jgi:predicted alpha-1,6-mannanase (GH76 family)